MSLQSFHDFVLSTWFFSMLPQPAQHGVDRFGPPELGEPKGA